MVLKNWKKVGYSGAHPNQETIASWMRLDKTGRVTGTIRIYTSSYIFGIGKRFFVEIVADEIGVRVFLFRTLEEAKNFVKKFMKKY